MKKIINIAIICGLLISQSSFAQQVCKDYIINEWPDFRYTDYGNGTVMDNKTNLMWKKCSEGQTNSDCSGGFITTHNWQEALEIPQIYNNSGGVVGYTDWRLPNIEELRSLVAYNCYLPAINTNIFPNNSSPWFWASSPIAFSENGVWVINFDFGSGGNAGRHEEINVRLVRSPGQ